MNITANMRIAVKSRIVVSVVALPFKIAHFEPQYLTCFKTNLNAILQVNYNGNGLTNYLFWY